MEAIVFDRAACLETLDLEEVESFGAFDYEELLPDGYDLVPDERPLFRLLRHGLPQRQTGGERLGGWFSRAGRPIMVGLCGSFVAVGRVLVCAEEDIVLDPEATPEQMADALEQVLLPRINAVLAQDTADLAGALAF